MKAIVNSAPGKLEMLDYPTPAPAEGQVRIKTLACAVCVTDIEMIDGWERTGFPAIPGHEWCGIVDETGPGVEESLAGALFVGENVLSGGGEVGFEHPGGYGEFFLTEAANLHLLPPGFPPETATLIEPLAVCARGLKRLAFEGDSPALVIGDGPIGLLMLMLLKRAGAENVYLAGGRPWRLRLAEDLGAAGILNYHSCSDGLARAFGDIVGEQPLRTIIETSGSGSAMESALEMASLEAKILVLGDYAGTKANFPWNDLLHGEWELIGSCASAGAWEEAVRIAIDPAFDLARLVTHRLPAADFDDAISLMRSKAEGVVKIVLTWDR